MQHASAREVLSLEEILAEGANGNTCDRDRRLGRQVCIIDDPIGRGSLASSDSQVVKLTKQQIKTLQEAMYHSAESGHLGKLYIWFPFSTVYTFILITTLFCYSMFIL